MFWSDADCLSDAQGAKAAGAEWEGPEGTEGGRTGAPESWGPPAARRPLTVLPPLPITRPAVEEGTLMWASSFTSSLGLKKFSSFSFPKIRPCA